MSETKEMTAKEMRDSRFYVKVHPLQAEGKEKDNPIPVNDLGDHANGRAVVYPNKKGILSQVQINILREAVERHKILISEDSGILDEKDPLAAAEKQYPGFTAMKDRATGSICVCKEVPRFSVEVLGPVKKTVATTVKK